MNQLLFNKIYAYCFWGGMEWNRTKIIVLATVLETMKDTMQTKRKYAHSSFTMSLIIKTTMIVITII